MTVSEIRYDLILLPPEVIQADYFEFFFYQTVALII